MAEAMRHRSVFSPRSSNRTCGFTASGSPTGFTSRHTVDCQFGLVSRDDTVARNQLSPCGRAPSEASGYFQVLQAHRQSPILGSFESVPEVRVLSSAGITRPHRSYDPVRLPPGPPCSPRRWRCDLRPERASPDYPDHLSNVPCPIPRWIGTGAYVGCFPIPRGLPRFPGGSASTISLSRPAQTSLALRPAGSLNRPRRPLSRGFETAGYPTAPLVSYQINRQLSGWYLPPLVIRAFGAHVESRRGAVAEAMRHRSVFSPRSSNRTCGFTASGSPTGFTSRHTVDCQFGLVSRDDTVARNQLSPCGRAPSEASGYFQVLQAHRQSPILGSFESVPEVRVLSSAGITRPHRSYDPVRLPPGPPCSPRRWRCDLRPERASPDYPDHLSNVPCPIPRWIGTGAYVGCFPIPRGLPRFPGGSASTISLSRPAQTSLALRPAGSLNRPRRPLSRGFETAGYPTAPLVSYQINRQLSGWYLPPLVIRAFGAHVESRRGAVAEAMRHRSVFSPRSSNRTCGFTASGSPTGFTSRHTVDCQFGLVSRDDTVARNQLSPCGRAPSEASGYFQVLQAHRQSPILGSFESVPEVRVLSSAGITRPHRSYDPVRLPPGPPCSPRRWRCDLRPERASPDYPDHLSNVPCPIPRWIGTGAYVGCFPIPRGLPRFPGGSASTISLSRPAQTSLALRPAGSLNRPRRPLSRGFETAGYPTAPLVSYQINRQLSGWYLPPLVIRAFGAHVESRRGAVAEAMRHRSVFSPRSSNRTCGFTASGSPTGFTSRHTVDCQFGLVSRDDTVARNQLSPCGRAPSEASGYFQVLQAHRQSPILGSFESVPEVRVLSSAGITRPHRSYDPVRLPPGPPCSPRRWRCDLRPERASPDYPDHLSNVPCPIPRWIGTGAYVGCFPIPRGLPRFPGGSASTISLSRPAQTSLALRPAGSLNRPRRPLSRGFETAGYPTAPLVSYQINRQLSGWYLPPLVIRAFGAHWEMRATTTNATTRASRRVGIHALSRPAQTSLALRPAGSLNRPRRPSRGFETAGYPTAPLGYQINRQLSYLPPHPRLRGALGNAGYNNQRYHESIGNVTPADAYFGRHTAIIEKRKKIKKLTTQNRRLNHQSQAA